jgi:hypothetical protein
MLIPGCVIAQVPIDGTLDRLPFLGKIKSGPDSD